MLSSAKHVRFLDKIFDALIWNRIRWRAVRQIKIKRIISTKLIWQNTLGCSRSAAEQALVCRGMARPLHMACRLVPTRTRAHSRHAHGSHMAYGDRIFCFAHFVFSTDSMDANVFARNERFHRWCDRASRSPLQAWMATRIASKHPCKMKRTKRTPRIPSHLNKLIYFSLIYGYRCIPTADRPNQVPNLILSIYLVIARWCPMRSQQTSARVHFGQCHISITALCARAPMCGGELVSQSKCFNRTLILC